VLRQIEEEFPEAIEQTRNNRFRSHQDTSLTSFFYHHYAEISGLGAAATASTFLVRPENAKRFARRALGKRTYQSICINDGDGSAQNPAFNEFKRLFLDHVFPYASECEIRP
jgi:hypothetical protein